MFLDRDSDPILYLTNRQLVFFLQRPDRRLVLDFPQDTVVGLEVVSQEKLESLVRDFFEANKLRGQKAVLILSEEVLFTKEIEGDSLKQAEVDRFWEEVPLEPAKVSQKMISQQGKLKLLATSGQYFRSIVEILGRYGWRITAVVPATILAEKIDPAAPVDLTKLTHALGDRKLVALYNLLDQGEGLVVSPKQLIFIIVVVLALLAMIILAVVQTFERQLAVPLNSSIIRE